jgi:hypothetical protein
MTHTVQIKADPVTIVDANGQTRGQVILRQQGAPQSSGAG